MKWFAENRPRALAIGVFALVILGSGLLALRLSSTAGPGTLADRDGGASRATARLHGEFGDEPITILIRSRNNGCPGKRDCRLLDLVLTPDLLKLLSLEGCIAGNVPRGAKPPAPVCQRFANTRPFAAVNGPGTFINESARQIAARIKAQQRSTATNAAQAARDARRVAAAQGLGRAEQDRLARKARELAYLNSLQPALRYGLSGQGPQVIDSGFVHELVFDARLGFDMPKTRFSHLFPNRHSARIEVVPRAGLSGAERRSAIALLRTAVADPSFRLDSATYLVSGFPVASEAVASHISASIMGVGLVALLVCAVALRALFRSRRWFLPLLSMLLGAAVAFGALSLTGGSLTIASIAVVPVLAAIAGGYATVLQLGSEGRARSHGFPVASLVALVALVSLVFSPAPMIRSFGLVVALGLGFTLLFTRILATTIPDRPAVGLAARRSSERGRQIAAIRDLGRRALQLATRRPTYVLAVAALAAILGWALQSHIGTAAGLDRIAPSDVGAVKDLERVEQDTRTAGDVAVVVKAKDVAAPGVLSWMSRYERRVLQRHGYGERRPCRAAELCPAASLTSLLGAVPRSDREAKALVKALPTSFSRGVVSSDNRTAVMSFDINAVAQTDQDDLVRDLRDQLDPPPGVTAELAGRPALTEETDSGLKSSAHTTTLIALLAAFLVLLAIHRSASWAAAAVIPIALATGWLQLVLLLVGRPINPLSAALGAFAVAITTQLAVPVSTRYRNERAAGASPAEAVERSFGLPGDALGVAAAVTIAGLSILIVSDVRMLQDFGIESLAAVVVVLAGLAIVLPATLVLNEEGGRVAIIERLSSLARGVQLGNAKTKLGRALHRRDEAQRP